MEKYTDSFNEHSYSVRVKREAADRDDLNFAQSGAEVGRIRKHLPSEEVDPITGKRKKQAEIEAAIQRTLDWLLLNDAAYRQAHENLMGSIRSAQTAIQMALERLLDYLQLERSIMDDVLSSAAKLPDGKKVFKDKHGNVRNEDGEIIPPELAANIEWTGQEPSYEEYLAQRQRIEELEAYERELRGIEIEIGEIHERGNRKNEPLTPEELERDTDRVDDLEKRTREIDANAKAQLSKDTEATTSNSVKVSSTAQEKVPDISFGSKP